MHRQGAHSWISVLLVIASACMAAGQTDPQGTRATGGADDASPDVIRVNVHLAVLDAQVLNKKTGKVVRALTPSDFLLFENGVAQPIASVSQDELPISVVFLFDLTDSVRPVLKPLADGAQQALQHLKPGDEAAVMVYASSARLLQDFTTDHDLLSQAIGKASRMESPDAAFFNEGVYQAAEKAAEAANGRRRVIIWLTDNVPNIPSEDLKYRFRKSVPREGLHSEQQAIAELLKSGTVVCTLLQRSEISEREAAVNRTKPIYILERSMYPPGDVYQYTRQSGGQVMESWRRSQISQRLADLIDQIRLRYAVAYHPATIAREGRLHPVKLEISPEVRQREGKLILNAQQSYYR